MGKHRSLYQILGEMKGLLRLAGTGAVIEEVGYDKRMVVSGDHPVICQPGVAGSGIVRGGEEGGGKGCVDSRAL